MSVTYVLFAKKNSEGFLSENSLYLQCDIFQPVYMAPLTLWTISSGVDILTVMWKVYLHT